MNSAPCKRHRPGLGARAGPHLTLDCRDAPGHLPTCHPESPSLAPLLLHCDGPCFLRRKLRLGEAGEAGNP